MAYVEDFARSWSPVRKTRSIERSVDRAVAATKANEAAFAKQCRAERRAAVASAKALVADLPEPLVARMAAKTGQTADQGRKALFRRAECWPDQIAQLCRAVSAQAEAA